MKSFNLNLSFHLTSVSLILLPNYVHDSFECDSRDPYLHSWCILQRLMIWRRPSWGTLTVIKRLRKDDRESMWQRIKVKHETGSKWLWAFSDKEDTRIRRKEVNELSFTVSGYKNHSTNWGETAVVIEWLGQDRWKNTEKLQCTHREIEKSLEEGMTHSCLWKEVAMKEKRIGRRRWRKEDTRDARHDYSKESKIKHTHEGKQCSHTSTEQRNKRWTGSDLIKLKTPSVPTSLLSLSRRCLSVFHLKVKRRDWFNHWKNWCSDRWEKYEKTAAINDLTDEKKALHKEKGNLLSVRQDLYKDDKWF